MGNEILLFAYIGPDVIVPFASAAAAVGGLLMMFWTSVRGAATWCFRKLSRTTAEHEG